MGLESHGLRARQEWMVCTKPVCVEACEPITTPQHDRRYVKANLGQIYRLTGVTVYSLGDRAGQSSLVF